MRYKCRLCPCIKYGEPRASNATVSFLCVACKRREIKRQGLPTRAPTGYFDDYHPKAAYVTFGSVSLLPILIKRQQSARR